MKAIVMARGLGCATLDDDDIRHWFVEGLGELRVNRRLVAPATCILIVPRPRFQDQGCVRGMNHPRLNSSRVSVGFLSFPQSYRDLSVHHHDPASRQAFCRPCGEGETRHREGHAC